MIALLVAAWSAEPIARFERVDLFASDGASWWTDDLPRLGLTPRVTALRWASQVRVVADLPRGPFFAFASIAHQGVGYRADLGSRAVGGVGLSTRLGMPSAAWLELATWRGPVRLGAAIVLDTHATWARPTDIRLEMLPALCVGIGRQPRERW